MRVIGLALDDDELDVQSFTIRPFIPAGAGERAIRRQNDWIKRVKQRLLSLGRLLPLRGLMSMIRLLIAKMTRKEFVCLRVHGVTTPLFARLNNSDLSVLYQVFGQMECDVGALAPALIIDGGANVGYSSVYFALRYPSAKIVAMEPSADNCWLFRMNCVGFPNVQLIQGAIWSSRALLEICDPDERGWMIQVRETAVRTPNTFEAYTIPDLIAMGGGRSVDILKLDIEGAEGKLFSSNDLVWLDQIQCLIIETHGGAIRSLVLDAMKERGYSCRASGEKLVFKRNQTGSTSQVPA